MLEMYEPDWVLTVFLKGLLDFVPKPSNTWKTGNYISQSYTQLVP